MKFIQYYATVQLRCPPKFHNDAGICWRTRREGEGGGAAMFWACAYSSYAKLFLIDIGIQWAGATAAIIFKTEKFYDLLGAVTNILLAQLSYEFSRKQTVRQLVQSNLVTLWAARLGLYLFIRILKDGRDKRFADAKKKPIIMYVFWTVQAAWCYVTLLPTLMLNEQARDPPLGPQASFSVQATMFATMAGLRISISGLHWLVPLWGRVPF